MVIYDLSKKSEFNEHKGSNPFQGKIFMITAACQDILFHRVPWNQGQDYPVLALSRWHRGDLSACFSQSHAPERVLKEQRGYRDAKYRGDIAAARRIVQAFLKPDSLSDIQKLTQQADTLVVSPCTASKGRRNVLPITMAHHIAHHLELRVNKEIFQHVGDHKTGQEGMDRLFNHPGFYGPVHRGRNYLIVDDVLTMGGTVADLRSHIERKGGRVVGTVVLAHTPTAAESRFLRPLRSGGEVTSLAIDPLDVHGLKKKFGPTLSTLCRRAFGFGPECFTVREGGFVARLPDLDPLRGRCPG